MRIKLVLVARPVVPAGDEKRVDGSEEEHSVVVAGSKGEVDCEMRGSDCETRNEIRSDAS